MSKETSQSTQREEVLEGVIRLLDISIDINKRIEDLEFSKKPGAEIFYVFDENVFELFIDPSKDRFRVTSFFDSYWLRKTDRRNRRFIEQARLLAAETVLTGVLPGAVNNRIYMSGWHQRELAGRLEKIQEAMRQPSSSQLSILAKEIRQKAEVRQSLDDWSAPSEVVKRFLDLYIAADEEIVSSEGGVDAAIRLRNSRVLANLFATCSRSEQIEQLNRIAQRGIGDRIASIEARFGINTMQEISQSARQWQDRLLKEAQRVSEMSGRSTKRGKGGFVWDANCLALLQWISSNKLRENQRIVFVTGDELLYSAYRRWYCDIGERRNKSDEFLLRRISQYSPVLSTDEFELKSGAVREQRSEATRLVSDILMTVEVSLLPFNLSLLHRENLEESSRNAIFRARHDLVLRYLARKPDTDDALAYFERRLQPIYFERQSDKLEEIRALWRTIERLTVAAYHDTLRGRLEFRDRVFNDRDIPGDADNVELESAIGRVISETATDLFNRLAERWVPAAVQFLEDLKSDEIISTRRAPKSIWYKGSDGSFIANRILQWKLTEDNGSGLIEVIWGSEGRFKPYDVFGLAAAFALYSHGWAEAENFSDLAIRSGFAYGADQETLIELQYIRCVARRFVFADERSFYEIGGDAGASRRMLMDELHAKAIEALAKSKELCRSVDDVHYRSLLLSRLGLESASLDLMLLAISYQADFGSERRSGDRQLLERSFERLERVGKLLDSCEDGRRVDLLEQFDGTLAAAVCVDFLLNGAGAKTRKLSDELAARLVSIGKCEPHDPDRSFHLLTVLYASARLIRSGSDANCSSAIRQAIENGKGEFRRLAFDRSMERCVVQALDRGGLI
ncbi:hypothetical protein [Sulfitobacter pacificus]|uniref:Uncharacterized protein n=1 Tax=Sulfitobacter pacificus TaxID=1499314 RepID=A0ABQ5VQ95_9RHOB|nr:hypothetical protein [Sulfitobacter pacificus]GLQ29168.1 hypothetical protein GCM10007927_39710 [Sulfitobacter pacificus]